MTGVCGILSDGLHGSSLCLIREPNIDGIVIVVLKVIALPEQPSRLGILRAEMACGRWQVVSRYTREVAHAAAAVVRDAT
jgi:hypothetical protein